MITLYIKTHNKTKLKYFGKTTSEDVHTYRGSGKYWLRHIKKHGYDVTTEILKQFTEECEELIEDAINFSKENNIVKSKEWANLKEENGLDGGWEYINSHRGPGEKYNRFGENNSMYRKTHTKESRQKISNAISGENHHYFGIKRCEEECKKISINTKLAMSNLTLEQKEIMKEKRLKAWNEKSEDEKKLINNKISNTIISNLAFSKTSNWIYLYDNKNNLVKIYKGTFSSECAKDGYPSRVLKISYQNNGAPIYQKNPNLAKPEYRKYAGWYALNIEKGLQ